MYWFKLFFISVKDTTNTHIWNHLMQLSTRSKKFDQSTVYIPVRMILMKNLHQWKGVGMMKVEAQKEVKEWKTEFKLVIFRVVSETKFATRILKFCFAGSFFCFKLLLRRSSLPQSSSLSSSPFIFFSYAFNHLPILLIPTFLLFLLLYTFLFLIFNAWVQNF